MDAAVEDPEEGGVEEGLAGRRAFVGGFVGCEVCRPRGAAREEVCGFAGDEEDGRDEVGELVLVLVGGDGDEATLSARFFCLVVGETGPFGRGEVELDAGLGERGIGGQFLGELEGGEREAGLAEVVGADDLSEVEGGDEAGEDRMG